MTRVLVVGMNPSAVEKIRKNSTLDRLNNWMSAMDIQYYSFMNAVQHEFDKVNQVDVNRIELKIAASNYEYIIALGGFVSEALDSIKVKHYKLPHPSPRNRLLNDKQYVKDVIRACKYWLTRN